jgi:Putative adhesin
MKTTLALAGLALVLGSPAPAQDTTGQRIVVPARNSSRPRKLTARAMHGSITVKAYAGKDVIVETSAEESRESRGRRERVPEGMHRIDLPPRGLTVEEEDNQINVHSPAGGGAGMVISVPADTSLDLNCMNCPIHVEGVNGEIAVESMNGRVTLSNVSGNVLAHSMNGALTVSMNRVDPAKPLSFTTMNGTIDVTLPADYKGNVKLSTGHGDIYSDFDFKLGGGTITQSNNTSEGRFRVTMERDRTLVGTINGGGAEATFKTYNGTIYIRKKK